MREGSFANGFEDVMIFTQLKIVKIQLGSTTEISKILLSEIPLMRIIIKKTV